MSFAPDSELNNNGIYNVSPPARLPEEEKI